MYLSVIMQMPKPVIKYRTFFKCIESVPVVTAKKKSLQNAVQYMYGVCAPHNAKEALELDRENSMIIGKGLFGSKINNSWMNNLEIYQADVGNVYLEKPIQKKRYSSSLAKNLPPSVWKAMYSLYLKHYMGYIQEVKDSMRFSQTHFIWKHSHLIKLMRCNGDTNEYVTVYVND